MPGISGAQGIVRHVTRGGHNLGRVVHQEGVVSVVHLVVWRVLRMEAQFACVTL